MDQHNDRKWKLLIHLSKKSIKNDDNETEHNHEDKHDDVD